MKKLLLASAVLCLGLTSCGFEPMYGTHSPGASQSAASEQSLNNIGIAMIPDRQGQILRNELIDRFYHNGEPSNPRYTLSFADLNVNIRELDLTKSAEVTRSQIVASTTMYLDDNETGTRVLGRNVSSISSYNVLSSKFASRVTEENARENSLKDLARQIELQLTLYFDRDPEVQKRESARIQQEKDHLIPLPKD